MACMNSNVIDSHSLAQSSLNKGKIYKGICYLAMFTVVSLAILFYITSTPQTLSAFTRLDHRYFILATLLMAIDILLGAWRNHVLVQKIKPGVKLWLCLKAQLANEFGSAVTPGQGGGGPAWLYVLYRGGIAVAPAISVSVIIFLSTLFFYQLSTAASVVILSNQYSSRSLLYLLQIGFLISTGMFFLVLFSLCMPRKMSGLINAVFRPFRNSRKTWALRLSRIIDKINDGLVGYLRLRDIKSSHRSELDNNNCMIIRELKIVGQEIPLGKKNKNSFQHIGYGKKLIQKAEKICIEEYNKKKLFVLSGIGVKDYYRKLNYKDKGFYLYKTL